MQNRNMPVDVYNAHTGADFSSRFPDSAPRLSMGLSPQIPPVDIWPCCVGV